MMFDLKKLLKNGVFGIMTDGKEFVVVNDRLIYKNGGYDRIEDIDDTLQFGMNTYGVDKLFNALSFDNLEVCINLHQNVLYDSRDYKVVEMTVAEIEAKLGIKNLRIKK